MILLAGAGAATLVTACGCGGDPQGEEIAQPPVTRAPPEPDPDSPSCPETAPGFGMMQGPPASSVGLNQAVAVPGSTKIYVCRDGQGLFAINNTCTHAGCPVNFVAASSTWLCPCHGSAYAYTGEVTGGPAKVALARYGACELASGYTLIDMTDVTG